MSSRFGVIYAGAQKNIGPAGLVIVIVREDLLGRARAETPGAIDFKAMAANDSMWNTPPTSSWYVAGLVFEWLQEQGGLAAMEELNGARRRSCTRRSTARASTRTQSRRPLARG